ncbi:hypothetical protein SEA_CHRIDISON_43 [Arthrobacter phage Chridison]|nr:hypothetical protein SEA_CHRIDISON_43 [Arthrobacter phage Chridison]
MSMVQMEAYLGPSRPDTLASGMGEDGSPVAVVKCWPESDRAEWVGAYATTEDALAAIRKSTDDETYGVLCSTRKVAG